MSTELDVYSAEAVQDPYPVYARLRNDDPVHWSERDHAWIISRYDDSWELQNRSDLSVDRHESHLSYLPDDCGDRFDPLVDHFSRWLLYMDGDGHDRLKKLFLAAFTPAAVRDLEPRIQSIVDAHLDAFDPSTSDVVADFARPLPVTVIGDLLGLPRSDLPLIVDWTRSLGAFLFQGVDVDKTLTSERALGAIIEQRDYFTDLLDARRVEPRDDLLTAMARAEVDGERMTYEEIHSTCTMLVLAGNGTTASLIASAIYYLAEFPDQLAMLRDDRDLIEQAVEEALRIEAPTQRGIRTALVDFELRGRTISRGDILHIMIGAANRDPEQFTNADRLDITRTPNRHTSLGHGLHFCLGAHLARLEARVAIGSFIDRYPDYSVADDPVRWVNATAFRALRSLHITPNAESANLTV